MLITLFSHLLAADSVTLNTVSDTVPVIARQDLVEGTFIGNGSFGDVYRGTWQGQDVAIKKLHIRSFDVRLTQDFNNETRVMWQCQFPNIVKLLGVCNEPGYYAMVLELMPNGSLYELLHSETNISESERYQIALDIAQGVDSLHRHNVTHRDLKSRNVLLDERSEAKISDFGLARLRIATTTTSTPHRPVGTVRWRAPELLAIRPPTPNPAMDIYSYGMVLWELVSRKVPFENQPDDQIVIGDVRRGAREEIPHDCHPILREIIKACWQNEPSHRPTAAHIVQWLNRTTITRADLGRSFAIPDVVQGHEAEYLEFLRGRLIFKPCRDSDEGRIEIPIAALADPLKGTFDLSQCGGIGRRVSIGTGYRKISTNECLNEVWLVPRFMANSRFFLDIMDSWPSNCHVGIFWRWSEDDLERCNYLTWKTCEEISQKDLFENWRESTSSWSPAAQATRALGILKAPHITSEGQYTLSIGLSSRGNGYTPFYISFVN